MGLFNIFKKKREDNQGPLPPQVSAFLRASLPNRAYGGRVLDSPEDYDRLAEEYTGWAYACSRKNAQTIASVPLRLYRGVPGAQRGKVRKSVPVRPVARAVKDKMFECSALMPHMNKAVDVEEVLQHPWLEILRTVNRNLNGFTLIELTGLFKQVTGNAYWLVPRNEMNIPAEIWVLPSQYVGIVPDDKRYIQSYVYGVSNPKEVFPADDVVHFKYPNVKSIYFGAGPLEAAFTSQALNEDFDEFERAMLDNGAIMPAAFSPEQPLSKPALARLRKDITKVHGGHKNAGKFGMLQQGLKMLPMAWNPKDINYAIGLKTTKEKIAGIFGVPLSKLGVEDVNRSNAEAGNHSYMKDTIAPDCIAIADTINQSIMPLYDDKLFVVFDDCVPADKEFTLKLETARIGSGVITLNEVREGEGLDPIDNGDEPLLPGSLKPLSQIVAEPEPMPIPMAGEPAEDEDDEAEMLAASYYYGPLSIRNTIEKKKSIERDGEEEFERAAAKWIRNTVVIVSPFISQFTVGSVAEIDSAIPWQEVVRSGENALIKPMAKSLQAGAEQATANMAKGISRTKQEIDSTIGIAWDIQSPEAIAWASKYVGERITVITDDTKAAIREMTARGIREGKNPRKWAREMRDQIGLNVPQQRTYNKLKDELTTKGLPQAEIDKQLAAKYKKQIKYRAEMIGRTESAMAYAEGEIESYKNAGITKVSFSPANDACPICARLSGREYTLQDAHGVIPVHPHCRCDWLSVEE